MRRIIKLKYFNASRHRLFIFATIFIIVATILIVSLTTSKGISSSSDDDDEKGDGDENDEIKKVHHTFKLPDNARHYNRTVKPHGRKWRNHANYTSPIEVYYVGSFDQLITKDNPIQIIIVDNGKDNKTTLVSKPILFDILFNETFNAITCSGAVMANIRWKMAEDYYIDTRGPHCMSDSFIMCTFLQAFNMWQTFMNFDPFASNPILEPTSGILYNNRNEVQFGSIDINGHTTSIALTSVWWDGTQFVEWDQIYNTMYAFGDAEKDSNKMDLPRIATHEFGHVLGLIDIYDTACIPYTIMYGYATYGDFTNRMPKLVDINALTNLGYPTSDYGSRVYNTCPGYNDKCVKTVPTTTTMAKTTTTPTTTATTTPVTTTTTKTTTKATTTITTTKYVPTTTKSVLTTTKPTTTITKTTTPTTTTKTTTPTTTTKTTTPTTTTKTTTPTTTTKTTTPTTTTKTTTTSKKTTSSTSIVTKPSTVSSTTTKKPITTVVVPKI